MVSLSPVLLSTAVGHDANCHGLHTQRENRLHGTGGPVCVRCETSTQVLKQADAWMPCMHTTRHQAGQLMSSRTQQLGH